MQETCEFCKQENKGNHLLECEMVLSHYFGGTTSLVCIEETNISLISTIKKPGKLPILRWKTIQELCKELKDSTHQPNSMMYT